MKKKNSTPEHTNRLIDILDGHPFFTKLSDLEEIAIDIRDKKDEENIERGIGEALERGLIKVWNHDPSYITIYVDGKSADNICDEIMGHISNIQDDFSPIILAGLSGIGKGTTADYLQKRIKKSYLWSNGNLFRIIYWQCQLQKIDQRIKAGTISKKEIDVIIVNILDNVKTFIESNDLKILFTKKRRIYDIGKIKNTILKKPSVEGMVETMASVTQGHVINYVRDVVDDLSESAIFILEGRKETLDHVPSEKRFELVIRDRSVLGKRRAAQKIAAGFRRDVLTINDDELRKDSLGKCEKLLSHYRYNGK